MAEPNGWQRLIERLQKVFASDITIKIEEPYTARITQTLNPPGLGESRWSLDANCSATGYPSALELRIEIAQPSPLGGPSFVFGCSQLYSCDTFSGRIDELAINNSNSLFVETVGALRWFVDRVSEDLIMAMEKSGWSDRAREIIEDMIQRLGYQRFPEPLISTHPSAMRPTDRGLNSLAVGKDFLGQSQPLR